MRVLLDTNILLSALMVSGMQPARLYEYWKNGRFALVSCEQQLEEINRVSHRPFFMERFNAGEAARLINDIRQLALIVETETIVRISADPADDFLLATAWQAQADYLVSGDKRGLLALQQFATTRIVTARYLVDFLDQTTG